MKCKIQKSKCKMTNQNIKCSCRVYSAKSIRQPKLATTIFNMSFKFLICNFDICILNFEF